MLNRFLTSSACALACMLSALPTEAATRTWTGGGDGTNWFAAANWDVAVPANGDGAVIGSGATVLLTNDTAQLASLAITNASLTFSNWTTRLRSTNVTVQDSAWLTHTPCTTNLVASNTNRVHIVCSSLTIEAGGAINVNTKGYPGGNNVSYGYGPGRATAHLTGAGHGGVGGKIAASLGGKIYGSLTAPMLAGSGGSGSSTYIPSKGGDGGGAVRIDASGHVLINGSISANGGTWSGSYGGGGSGGGIYITCGTFAGTNGVIRANGANCNTGANVSGGGGGRIALAIGNMTGQASLPRPTVAFSANRGTGGHNETFHGQLGTVHLPVPSLLQGTLGAASSARYFGFTTLDTDTLTVNSGWIGMLQDGFVLNVTNDLQVLGSGGRLDFSNATVWVGGDTLVNAGELWSFAGGTSAPVFSCDGDTIVTNGAELHVQAGSTNGAGPDYGGRLAVAGALDVTAGGRLYPHSHPTNGGSLYITAASLLVAFDAQVNADGLGYLGGDGKQTQTPGLGPGRGGLGWTGAAGHGGVGAKSTAGYGLTYGSSNAPIAAGSGGACYVGSRGGPGGGVVRMEIANTATIDGTVSANGGSWSGSYGSGGAGGSIYLRAKTFGVASGTLRANGGNGSSSTAGGGGGGGGRIALVYRSNGLSGPVLVSGGISGYSASTGGVGTIHFETMGGLVTLRVLGSPELHGASAPYNYGNNGVEVGEWVTNSVNSPADESGGIRYVCTGWSLTNDAGASASGATTQAVFQVTTNTDLTWYWKQQCYLATTAGSNGTLLVNQTGWHLSTGLVSVTAVPDGGRRFVQWTGSGVPSGDQTNNPLVLPMDQPRVVEAKFANATPTTRTWNGTGNWFSEANWSSALGAGIPGPGDTAVIQSGTCSPDEPVRVAALTVGNGAVLSFTNWHTLLAVAGDVTVQSGGEVTHAGPFRDDEMSNRVAFACANFTVDSGGKVDTDAAGFHGGVQGALQGHGPGGARASIKGAGHGGHGGGAGGGLTYGSIQSPVLPGSGGAGYSGVGAGGHGGGAVRIDASGQVTVNGSITANGGNYLQVWGSGASGGSVFLTCATFDGAGVIQADGGNGASGSTGVTGSGGGRIAIVITNLPAQNAMPRPTVTYSADRGFAQGASGELGTIYLGGANLLPETIASSYNGHYHGISSWSPNALTLDNAWIGLMEDGMLLTVTNTLVVSGSSARLDVSNATVTVGGNVALTGGDLYAFAGPAGYPTLTCAGDISLTGGAVCHLYSGPTNPPAREYGAEAAVGGGLTLGPGCTLGLHTCTTNGGAPHITAGDVSVSTNARIHADATGFAGAGGGVGLNQNGYGPGGGKGWPGAGGYGGAGAKNTVGYGETYGSSNAPVHAGSGGGMYSGADRGGSGGGVVRIDVRRTLTVNGTVSADGGNWIGSYGGGGSGGSVYLKVSKLLGSAQGRLSATGGRGSTSGNPDGGGGGGGGRIAVEYRHASFAGAADVSGGIGGNAGQHLGDPGTIVWTLVPPKGTLVVIR